MALGAHEKPPSGPFPQRLYNQGNDIAGGGLGTSPGKGTRQPCCPQMLLRETGGVLRGPGPAQQQI